MTVRFESAVIFVHEVSVSREFYVTALGQEVEMDHGPNVSFRGGFSIWERAHASQIVYGRPPDPEWRPGEAGELYFETDDLDDVAACLSARDVEWVHPLREQPWGQRVLRVKDPDGHVVEIGEPMSAVIRRFLNEGLSPADVSARTSMPLELVSQIAQSEA